ncbi:MAG: DNA recombination protein RmuC [Deltaproteobacteria bacterium]|nr:DNA recombination protein RmuC [Deltaproteobacteria bacterium]MBI3294601.1 DNA recombination protein RmuC [Deltaproteobacteria bacterium]
MIWIAVAGVAVSVGGVIAVLLLTRGAQNNFKDGFSILKDSFESLQKNLILLQERTERSQQVLSTELRREVLEEMGKNRSELQAGLTKTTQLLDERVNKFSVNVQEKLELNIKEGFTHFEKVQVHLKEAGLQLQNLNAVGASINELNNLLKLPHLRGSFGESTLERLLADTLPADAFELQYRIVPNSTERVDAVIKMPQYLIPIDSKFPREQVLPLFECNDPAGLEIARKTLGEVLKGLAKQIRDKYVRPEHGTTDMALMFIPSETLYFECLRSPKLCEDLSKLKVFPVSPNTLSVTLHSISLARSYYDMAKGVEATIAELKKAQAHFGNFETRFTEVGKTLSKAQDSFQTAATHLSRYQSAVTRLSGVEASEPLAVSPPPANH